MESSAPQVRIDKWLWAARFFKTRGLASEAVNGGKVHCHGQRVKPSRIVQIGDELRIQRGTVEMTVVVQALSDQRRPAREAVLLYRETDDSLVARERQREDRQLLGPLNGTMRPAGRPTKRDRRLIRTFLRRQDET